MSRTATRPVVRPLVALAAALAMVLGLSAPPASAQSVAGTTIQNIVADLEDGGQFVGRIVNLVVDDEGLASGRIVGRVLDEAGNVVQRVNQVFEGIDITGLLDVVDEEDGACRILYLELAPILLDVLGLVVEIPEQIIVEIRAEPGPGNLLGNLLCAIVGLLD